MQRCFGCARGSEEKSFYYNAGLEVYSFEAVSNESSHIADAAAKVMIPQ